MRHKFIIEKNKKKKQLTIREYSNLEQLPKSREPGVLAEEIFSFGFEENYDLKTMEKAISGGISDLVVTLRTDNMFPIDPYILKIAESVTDLCNSDSEDSLELIFDDMELLTTE